MKILLILLSCLCLSTAHASNTSLNITFPQTITFHGSTPDTADLPPEWQPYLEWTAAGGIWSQDPESVPGDLRYLPKNVPFHLYSITLDVYNSGSTYLVANYGVQGKSAIVYFFSVGTSETQAQPVGENFKLTRMEMDGKIYSCTYNPNTELPSACRVANS